MAAEALLGGSPLVSALSLGVCVVCAEMVIIRRLHAHEDVLAAQIENAHVDVLIWQFMRSILVCVLQIVFYLRLAGLHGLFHVLEGPRGQGSRLLVASGGRGCGVDPHLVG